MKLLVSFTIIILFTFSANARPDTDKYIHCLFKSGTCTAPGPMVAPNSCGIVYGKDPCVGMQYFWQDDDDNWHVAKCCSKGIDQYSVGGPEDEVVNNGQFDFFTSEDSYMLRGRDDNDNVFDIYDFTAKIGDLWKFAGVRLEVVNSTDIKIVMYDLDTLGYIDSTTLTSHIVLDADIQSAYSNWIYNNPESADQELGDFILPDNVLKVPVLDFIANQVGEEIVIKLQNENILDYNPVMYISNLEGKLLTPIEVNNQQIKVSTLDYADGIYIVTLKSKFGIKSRKVLIH